MPAYSRDFVNYFNGFVMDLCNCLWRNRALNNADKNALGCQIPESLQHLSETNRRDVVGVLKAASEERGDILGTCFSLTHGTAFSLFAAQSFRKLEDDDPSVTVRHPGPVTLGSLKQHAAVSS
jgi:centromere protein I